MRVATMTLWHYFQGDNSVFIQSLSIDIFEIFAFVMLLSSNYFINFQIPFEDIYWCFWYFKKRRGDIFSSEVASILQMAYNKFFEFLVAVRGYNHYRRFWIPEKDQVLECFYETHNPFDRPSSSRNVTRYEIFHG